MTSGHWFSAVSRGLPDAVVSYSIQIHFEFLPLHLLHAADYWNSVKELRKLSI